MSNSNSGTAAAAAASPEAESFHASSTTALRRLTAIELLGRNPVAVRIPEFGEGVVVYMTQPNAKRMVRFFTERDRFLNDLRALRAKAARLEKEKAKAAAVANEDGVTAGAADTVDRADTIPDFDFDNSPVRKMTAKLIAEVITDQDGNPILTEEQVSEEMSVPNYQVLTREVMIFLGAMSPVSRENNEDQKKEAEDELESDLIKLEDEIDKRQREEQDEEEGEGETGSESGDPNPNA